MANPKIKDLRELRRIISRLKGAGKRIVFTNGCFDLLHRGHVEYLSGAKKMGDVLVVGLNSDSSVRRLKGAGRPVNSQMDRASVLAGLESVDYVVFFNEPTPERLIREVRPDLLVKGSDWKAGDIVGAGFVKSLGGRVVRVPFVRGYSTSSLIKRLSKNR